jgi:hypothetical protein
MMERPDFAVRPDLGGTRIPFIKEIIEDKSVAFSIFDTKEGYTKKITIPDTYAFLSVSFINKDGDLFLKGFYDFKGELKDTYVWLSKFCKQAEYTKNITPDGDLVRTLKYLKDSDTDLVLEAAPSHGIIYFYHCNKGRDENDSIIKAHAESLLVKAEDDSLFRFDLSRVATEILPVEFRASLVDGVLTLGTLIGKYLVTESLSTKVDLSTMDGFSNPREVKAFLDAMSIKS